MSLRCRVLGLGLGFFGWLQILERGFGGLGFRELQCVSPFVVRITWYFQLVQHL